MHHIGTVAMETERLLLRRFTEADAAPAFYNWTNDETVTEFLRWPTHRSQEITERVLKDWIAGYKRDDFYQWAIVLKEQGDEPIGTISVVGQNETLHSMQIVYCIGSKWWNKGIASEAFAAIIPILFNEVKVNRIEAQHDPENPGSGKVMEKCGLRYEGTLRQADSSNRGIVDAAIYSLLAREYRTAIEARAV